MASITMNTTNTTNTNEVLDTEASHVNSKLSADDWKNAERKLNDFELKVRDSLIGLSLRLYGINNINGDENSEDLKVVSDEFYESIKTKMSESKLIKTVNKETDKVNGGTDKVNGGTDKVNGGTDKVNGGTDKVNGGTKKGKAKVNGGTKKVNGGTNNTNKKIDLMRIENTIRIIMKELETAEKSFDYESFSLPSAFKLKILELRGIGYLQCLKYISQNRKEYLDSNGNIKKKKILFVFGIIIASEKFIDSVADFEGASLLNPQLTSKISQQFIEDFKIVLNEMKNIFRFDGMLCFYNAPQLIFYTDFDSAIPKKGIRPYEYQEKLTKLIFDALKDQNKSHVVTLRPMTGTGKTSSVVSIAKTIQQYNTTANPEDKQILLFCCNQRSVLNQAAQWLFNSQIPFATAFNDKERGLRIINNWNCKTDDKRVAIVLSPDAAETLLTMNDTNTRYVLFLDEPTIGADTKSSAARMNVKLMMKLPKISILSSATLPAELYPWLKENHEIMNGETVFHDIYSNRIHIGCDIKTFDGVLVVPHMGVTSGAELKEIITGIEGLPFLGRSYTINVVYKLYEAMKDINRQVDGEQIELPNIPEMFKDIKNLGTDSVRELAMFMLRILSNCSDDIITKVCATRIELTKIQTIEDEPSENGGTNGVNGGTNGVNGGTNGVNGGANGVNGGTNGVNGGTNDDDDIVWEKEAKREVTNKVQFELLGTLDAHRYLQQNLIATTDPKKFALKYFSNLLADVKTEVGSLKKLETQLQQQMALWQKEMQRMEKNERQYKSQLERLQKEEEMIDSKPSPNFPGKFQINTINHCKEYAKTSRIAIDRNMIRTELKLSDISYSTFNVDSDLILLLFCGVGVYTPGLCPNYLSSVMSLAEAGALAYFISDESVCYGTNWPIRRVFIDGNFSRIHSAKTIFQFISRAGRIGKSWIAEAFIDDECCKKIHATLHNTVDDIETKNLTELYEEIVSENMKKDEDLIRLIEELQREKEEKERQIQEEKERKQREKMERERLEREKMEREKVEREKAEKLEREKFTRKSTQANHTTQQTGQPYSTNSSNPRVSNVSSVTSSTKPAPVMDFARKSTGNVTRRTTISRTDKLNALKKQ